MDTRIRIEFYKVTTYPVRIRELRNKHGLSQEQLAEMISVSQNQISRYERGLNDPTGDILIALARALETSADYLLGITDDPMSPDQRHELTSFEKKLLATLRRGNKMEAARIILNE